MDRIYDNIKEDDETGCFIWQKSKDSWGYGHIRIHGKLHKTHRIMYEEYVGEIPEGMKVCHRCDTPSCCNPDHLFLGTDADNMRDRDNKDRQARGESHGTSKLTEEDVKSIKELLSEGDLKQHELSAIFNVGSDVISRINTGKAWKHIN